MAKLPSMQFYPGDWQKDPNLRVCSPAARGVWMDMLCLMFEAEFRGVLRSNSVPWSVKKIVKSVPGCRTRNVQELIDHGVARVARKDGAIYSKRLVRDELKRRHKARNGKLGGKQTGSKPEANTQAKRGSSSSSSTSTSKQEEKEVAALPLVSDFPELDVPEFASVWQQWIDYRTERRLPLSKRALAMQLRKLARVGVDNAIVAIEKSIENNWQGLFPDDPEARLPDTNPVLEALGAKAVRGG